MPDKLKFIPIDDTQNYPFGRLQLLVETFGHLTKWPQSWKAKIKKHCCKTLGTGVINCPMSPPSLVGEWKG